MSSLNDAVPETPGLYARSPYQSPQKPLGADVKLRGSRAPSHPLENSVSPVVVESEASAAFGLGRDLVCLSHLRWGFVFQRPQHLLTRCAQGGRVFFVEEPIPDDEQVPRMDVTVDESGVRVCVPRLAHGLDEDATLDATRALVDALLRGQSIERYVLWYYTPMARGFTDHLSPDAIVYDCMDELSAFKFAPAALKERERDLLQKADLVFTGGISLYESKKNLHPHVHAFPSSVDVPHFGKARTERCDPADQAGIAGPRLGFFGVIDERMDLGLLEGVARARPDWNFVMIGPVVKIDPSSLPMLSNVHYLGSKTYAALPSYVGGWDVAIMPFALNDSTRFISPTKTPEFLAAGRPVVSTPIQDVIRTYGDKGLVRIAATVDAFVEETQCLLEQDAVRKDAWLTQVDALLSDMSWDLTWSRMTSLIRTAVKARTLSNRSL